MKHGTTIYFVHRRSAPLGSFWTKPARPKIRPAIRCHHCKTRSHLGGAFRRKDVAQGAIQYVCEAQVTRLQSDGTQHTYTCGGIVTDKRLGYRWNYDMPGGRKELAV